MDFLELTIGAAQMVAGIYFALRDRLNPFTLGLILCGSLFVLAGFGISPAQEFLEAARNIVRASLSTIF